MKRVPTEHTTSWSDRHGPPYWLDLQDPEAVRGTRELGSLEAGLVVGLDRVRGCYTIWGPSRSQRSLVLIRRLEDSQGRAFTRNIVWWRVAQALAENRADKLTSADRAALYNARVDAARLTDLRSEQYEAASYFEHAFQGEMSGSGRHHAQDVSDGYFAARDSQKPAPKGQIISVAP